jgi:hypothetical protein
MDLRRPKGKRVAASATVSRIAPLPGAEPEVEGVGVFEQRSVKIGPVAVEARPGPVPKRESEKRRVDSGPNLWVPPD